jgi:quinone-modifying oxidoreductase subunit QmoC
MKASDEKLGNFHPKGSPGGAFGTALRSILTHQNFDKCTTEKPRYASHLLVVFGFIALGVVPIWIISGSIFNPLIRDGFVYPFHFLNPWRVLANLGGFAVLAGSLLMIRDRLNDESRMGSYFDWAFLLTVVGVVLSGFASEFLHYARLEPHRHLVYFGHLVLVFALIMYLPYSKFAHLLYRTVAMAYSEYSGRSVTAGAPAPSAAGSGAAETAREGEPKAEEGAGEGESKSEEAKKEEEKPEGQK